MAKRKRYTQQFKDDAVRLVQAGERSIADVAASLGVHRSQLSKWVSQAEVDKASTGPTDELTSTERAELARLRRENRQLTQERDFLKKAAAFFAKDSSKTSS
jgi:transposase